MHVCDDWMNLRWLSVVPVVIAKVEVWLDQVHLSPPQCSEECDSIDLKEVCECVATHPGCSGAAIVIVEGLSSDYMCFGGTGHRTYMSFPATTLAECPACTKRLYNLTVSLKFKTPATKSCRFIPAVALNPGVPPYCGLDGVSRIESLKLKKGDDELYLAQGLMTTDWSAVTPYGGFIANGSPLHCGGSLLGLMYSVKIALIFGDLNNNLQQTKGGVYLALLYPLAMATPILLYFTGLVMVR
eukprot:Blabericola_migrator_1__4161@NODE_2272_length_3024_cov_203_455529_g1429_i0_p2_GENE_NODE_2272_length_3024_cov_203_455529_g1429_i0NODE_2272_length_3024_cov_203_455529_g1429_i0_p2_ORF_typecomplete_len242_score38_29Thiolase_C/PF02803_18/6e02Thiolase_C/PF02803_18/0_55_NODE_2272_length_3024_cov_203_455529_g1429_i07921517